MNDSAAVLDFSRPFGANRFFDPAAFSENAAPIPDRTEPALQLKTILKRAGLTMRQLSAQTRMRFGEKSPYFIPQTFLYKQKTGITPHICQVVALSEITGYRFADCMNVCGFDLRLILALQLKIPNERTTIVTSGHAIPETDPSLEPKNPTGRKYHNRYYYVKIGSRDAVVYPKLRPGSIVRADRCYSPQILKDSSAYDHLWLVEHPAGLTCCHVNPIGDKQVVLLPNRPPLSPWPLHLSTQARILGLVDGELPYKQAEKFDPMAGEAKRESFAVPSNLNGQMSLSRLLRTSRWRTGLTLREAHKMTLRVARFLHDRDFGISTGLLSDYEAMNKLPRHIAKIISLCVIYGIDIWELLQAGGVHVNDSRRHPLFTTQRLVKKSVSSVSDQVRGSSMNWA